MFRKRKYVRNFRQLTPMRLYNLAYLSFSVSSASQRLRVPTQERKKERKGIASGAIRMSKLAVTFLQLSIFL